MIAAGNDRTCVAFCDKTFEAVKKFVYLGYLFLFFKAGRLVLTSPHIDLTRSFVRTTQNY
jgi:hypothetical protein